MNYSLVNLMSVPSKVREHLIWDSIKKELAGNNISKVRQHSFVEIGLVKKR